MNIKILLLISLLVFSGAAVSAQAKEKRPADVTLYGETLLAQINQYRQEN